MYPTKMLTNNYNVQEIGLAKAFIKHGHTCDIVSYNGSDKLETKVIKNNNHDIINYCIPGKNRLKNCFYNDELFSMIDNYDIIQTEEYDQLQNLKLLKKVKKQLYIYHGPYYNKFNLYNIKYYLKTILYDLLFLHNKSYKKLTAFSKSYLAELFLRKKGFKNIKTVGVGLDLDKFCVPCQKNGDIINLFKDGRKIKYLLYIGKIEPRRDTLFLIKVFSKIVAENNDVRLIIVGNGKQKYKNKCKKLIKKLDLSNHIFWFDALDQSEIPYLYQKCSLFILPTNYEIFGMVMLEAMYFGLPVVTTFNGGSSSVITNDVNGIIIKNKSIKKWSDVISNILWQDEKCKYLSSNAQKTINDSFTWDAISEKFLKVYLSDMMGDSSEKE